MTDTAVYPQGDPLAEHPAPRHAAASTPPSAADLTRVTVTPLASPLPLAFLALGVASFLVAMLQIGTIPMTEEKTLYLMLAIFVTPAQATAALISFRTREPLIASGIGLIAVTWPTIAVVSYTYTGPRQTPTSLGLLLIGVATALLLIVAPALVVKPLLGVTITAAAARYILTGVYDLRGGNDVLDAAAIAGFVVVGLCAYAAVALGIEDVRHKTVLPTFRLGEARQAMNGDLGFQVASVATEAGVRRQL